MKWNRRMHPPVAEAVMDDEVLVDGWIRRYENLERDNSATMDEAENFWPYQAFDTVVLHDPVRAFNLVLQILAKTQNDFVLSNLAAGPLEDLLARHGSVVIERVEHHAKVNDRFRDLLAGVWRNTIAEDIWQRVESAVRLNRNIH